MLDSFETFAAMIHIFLGCLIGYGYASTGRKRWVAWGLVLLLTVVEAVRFSISGPS